MDVMSCIRGNKDKMKLDADVLSFRSAKMLQRKLAARERHGCASNVVSAYFR